jgi:signal transduction histidine kinase
MLHEFLEVHRTELIDRCRAKVALRTTPRPTPEEMEHGIPLFLAQLVETLKLEKGPASHDPARPLRLIRRDMPAELSAAAAKHGHELLVHGFSVDQVVHDYGDLCQAVTELAIERDAPVSAEEFHTLNRCLDQAIADAVTEYARRRDQLLASEADRATNERLGFMAHEMRNSLGTAMLSFGVIRRGGVGTDGATAAVVDRSHVRLRDLIDRTLADVRLSAGLPTKLDRIVLAPFVAEVQLVASMEARAKSCEFTLKAVDPALAVCADRQLLFSALSNLLQNAFKFTHPGSQVIMRAYSSGDHVLIEVEDECGGLPGGNAEVLFQPFVQRGADTSGLGLGLSIATQAVQSCGGTLRARDRPGVGCVFTIDLPLAEAVALTA